MSFVEAQLETKEASGGILLNVLIVDDDGDSREVMAELVRMLGHHPITAESANEALSYVQDNHPNVCIVDLSLPDIDGCELIRRIRTSVTGDSMTLVVLTGHSDPGTRAAAKRAGADEYCLKPIDIKQLKDLFDLKNVRSAG